jgi:hypothetical protein
MPSNYVPVLVPERALPLVYRVLADLPPGIAGEESGPNDLEGPGGAGAVRKGATDGDWSPPLIERLVVESPPGALVILEALTAHAGEFIGADELAEALRKRLPAFGGPAKPEADWTTVAGTMGALSRRIQSRYKRKWPFQSREIPDTGRWVNSMRPEFAEQVRPHLETILNRHRAA